MKTIKYIFIVSVMLLLFACKKEKPPQDMAYQNSICYELKNISYGNNPEQVLDLYLPANRNRETKVFVLIHPGGWSAGSKEDMESMYQNLKLVYPQNAIVNIGYRLGTQTSPGFPKQIEDIGLALQEVKEAKYNISQNYFLLGISAGAHLSMLYGYKYDSHHLVKGICNIVGPTDFTDPSYVGNETFSMVLTFFLGHETYEENPELWELTSPAKQVTKNAPKTISFYGSADPLIPVTQMDLLHSKLDSAGVYNEKTMYEGEGHNNWSLENTNDYAVKLFNFIDHHF